MIFPSPWFVRRGEGAALCGVILVFVLQQASQLAATPLGEDLDFYGHWAYIVFYAQEGRWPRPAELSFPDQLQRLREVLPAPDHTDGSRYARWAQFCQEEKAHIQTLISAPIADRHYIAPNHQAQHPPLYYYLMSRIYKIVSPWNLAGQRYALALFSILLAASAFPALYGLLRRALEAPPAMLGLLGMAWYPNCMPFLGRVTNDALAFSLLAWCLWFCLASPKSWIHALAAGILLTAALFTKTYALTLVPVYLACFAGRPAQAAVAVALAALGVGALVGLNVSTTGHGLLLTEIIDTGSLGFLDKMRALIGLDPRWFFGGLAKGFFWCGYWSFVSPGYFYYLPLLGPGLLLLFRPRAMMRAGHFLSVRTLWPHYLALGCFTLGMMWHAALFSLHARQVGATVHSGNEGWYLDVLIGSVAVMVLVWAQQRIGARPLRRGLAWVLPLVVLWNALAREIMVLFWSGRVRVSGFSRTVDWAQVWPNLFDPSTYAAWRSCPGVLSPGWLTSALPWLTALVLSAWILRAAAGPRPWPPPAR